MYKVLTVALICVVAFNTAARASHGELVKKQAVYPGFIPQYAYQDSNYYPTQYPHSQAGVAAQGQSTQITSGPVSSTGSPVKQAAVPQKSGVYSPVGNSVSSQYPYPVRQYYPQIYPQNSQYPSVPSVFYIPSQGRFPAGANENAEQGSNAGSSGGSSGSWFGNNWSQNFPSWPTGQSPQFPSFPSNIPQPQFPSNLPQYPANFPQFPNQYPQFPSSFPSGNLPAFPGGNLPNFPSGNLPAFPGASPAGSAPGGASPVAVPGSEAGASGTTNTEVVGARRPEKIENADSTVEGTKNDADKVAADFPPQQYILFGQPQYVLQNGAHVPVVQNAAGKDPAQLESAAKGAVSSFLIQPQSAIAQQSPVQQFPHIPHNKIFSPQEFQELIQQIQLANKKVVENNNAAVPQFYVQQGVVPQRGVGQQFTGAHIPQGFSGQQSQDIPSQQFSGLAPQQYILQGVPAQVQQQYLQFSPQQQQLYVPQFASLPQQKPLGEVSSIPGASSAYQRFLLENQKPIKSTVVGNQNVEGGASASGSAPTPVSISSSGPPTATSNDSSSSPEPSNTSNDENESAGNTSGSKN